MFKSTDLHKLNVIYWCIRSLQSPKLSLWCRCGCAALKCSDFHREISTPFYYLPSIRPSLYTVLQTNPEWNQLVHTEFPAISWIMPGNTFTQCINEILPHTSGLNEISATVKESSSTLQCLHLYIKALYYTDLWFQYK